MNVEKLARKVEGFLLFYEHLLYSAKFHLSYLDRAGLSGSCRRAN